MRFFYGSQAVVHSGSCHRSAKTDMLDRLAKQRSWNKSSVPSTGKPKGYSERAVGLSWLIGTLQGERGTSL